MPQNEALTELNRFADAAQMPLPDWLTGHAMLASPDSTFSVETVYTWRRLGAESYVMQLSVLQPESPPPQNVTYIAKACISTPITTTFQEWMRRKSTLENANIPTPHTFAQLPGVTIQEYIPFSLKDVLVNGTREVRRTLTDNLTTTHQQLHGLGFRPLGLTDARSHGDNVVLIDFGHDLGRESSSASFLDHDAARKLAIRDLRLALGSVGLARELAVH
jgi:hypothetical protein